MSVTAALWAVLYCCAALFSFVNPLFGALGYLLEYYMRPELKWWGDALPSLRYNLIISITLGLTFVIRRSSLREMVAVRNPVTWWLFALASIMVLVTYTVAVDQRLSEDWSAQWIKMAIIFPLLVFGVVRSRWGFHAFAVAHMLGSFWWGYEAWSDPKRQAGRLVNIGSGDSLNDNAASAHLLTALPFCLIYLLTEKDTRLRAVGLLAAPFVINTIILCNSRGSMMGLLTAGLAAIFLVRKGYRLRIAVAGVCTFLALFLLADEQFITRQQSTANYQEDGSASQRLVTWQGAYELVKDRPFGAGGRGFHLLSPIYIPGVVELHGGDLRAPHNSYAMVASEWGIAGLISYIGIYSSAFLLLRRVKRQARPEEEGFFYWRALAVQLALTAYLVAGAFTDRLYGEAGYWMVALACALYRIQCTEQAESDKARGTPTPEEASSGTAELVPQATPAA